MCVFPCPRTDKETLVTDCGKLTILDELLARLKAEGHRVLIYSQMTRMIDILEASLLPSHNMFRCLFGDLSQTTDSKNQFLVFAMFKTVLLTIEKSFCKILTFVIKMTVYWKFRKFL